MARIPQSFIDELLTRVDIVDVIDKSVPLKKTGSNYQARCPFHNEKTPSFSVSQPKQFYYCFGCGASGNAIGFLIEHDHLNFVEAVRTLAQQVGMEVPLEDNDDDHKERRQLYDIMQQANLFYQQQLRQHDDAQKVITYLKNRGLSGKIAKIFQIGFAPQGWENLREHLQGATDTQLLNCGLLIKNENGKTYDRFRDRIMFPIRDRQGRTIGFGGRVLGDDTPKYLNSPETPIFHKGSELYGLYEAQLTNRHLEQLLVVEGYMDVIALAQYDITNAVATLGTATTKQNAERLFRYAQNIVFCFDGDKAGRNAAWRALENILPLIEDDISVRFMFVPEGEDPDSLVRAQGKAGFLKAVEKAMPLSRFLLNHLSENADLDTLDGRSRLTKLAEPYIKQIPGQVFQQMLVGECAKRAQMDAAELRSLYGLKSISVSAPRKMAPLPQESGSNTPMQQLLSLLLQYPYLMEKVDKSIDYSQLEVPGAAILASLLEKWQSDPNLNTGSLLEHWRNSKLGPSLAKLAMREILIPKTGLAAEVDALLAKINAQNNEAKLTLWQQKAANGELSNAEKKAYMALLAEQKR